MRAALLFGVTVGLVVGLAAPARAARGPVAVMPFKNLGGAHDLAWLSQGIAETMVADLKASGLPVVERDQLASALDEVLLQAAPAGEVSQAVSVGRLVGARTMVLGGFQRAAGKLRITARFVDVETGVVDGTAKVTGRLTRVFALQDQLTARLLGKKKARATKRRRARTKAAKPEKTVEAYRLYALSLDARGDEARQRFLKRALEVDPTFVYAVDDLNALERRMRGELRDEAAAASSVIDERELASLNLPQDPHKAAYEHQARQAMRTLSRMLKARRYYRLSAIAPRLYQRGLPSVPEGDATELAAWAKFLAELRLRRLDAAAQLGERYLEEFPAGAHRGDVAREIHKIAEERRTLAARQKEYRQELRDNDKERAERGRSADAYDRMSWDYHPCIAAKWSKLPGEMRENCAAFVKRYGTSTDPETTERVRDARAFVVWAHALRGEFAAARRLADALADDHPGQLAAIGLQEVIDKQWPTDIPARDRAREE